MSFGFSVTHFLTCGQLAYQLYMVFKKAPKQCAQFAKDLQHFSHEIEHTAGLVTNHRSSLTQSDHHILTLPVEDCAQLLCVRRLQGHAVHGRPGRPLWDFVGTKIIPKTSPKNPYEALGRRIAQVQYALQIPELQEAVSSYGSRLVSFGVARFQYGLSYAELHQC